jgi:hypothetical protein
MRRLLLISLLLTSAVAAWAEPQCGAGYSFYRTVTVDHTKVPNTDQTDFPVLISGTFTYLKTVGNSGNIQNTAANSISRTGPADLIFCPASTPGTRLSYEVASYSATTGTSEIWVKVPSVSHTVDTVFYMFYGNANVTTSQQDLCGTWSNSFVAVLHLPDGSSLDAKDSSCSQNDGTINSATATSGLIDGAASFSGSQTITRSSFTNQPLLLSARTIYAAIKPSAGLGGNNAIVMYGNDSGSPLAYALEINSSYHLRSEFDSGAGQVTGTATISQAAFTTVAATYNGSSNKLWTNGSADGSTSYSSAATSAGAINIGQWSSGGDKFHGTIDEIELSNVDRTGDWLTAATNNQNAPSTFTTIGSATTPTACTAGSQAQSVTIDATKAGTADTTNFPFVVSGYYSCLAQNTYGGSVTSASGYDIGLYSDALCTTKLDFELDTWDSKSGQIALWARIPTLSHTVNTVVYLCYGNSSITTNQSNKSGIWGSHGYVGVYHGGTPTSATCVSSGSDGLTLTPGGSLAPAQGLLGGALNTGAGSSDAFTCGFTPAGADKISNYGYPTGNAVFHWSAWSRINSLASAGCFSDCLPGGWGKTNGTGAAAMMWENRSGGSQVGWTPGSIETGSASVTSISGTGTPSFPYRGDYTWHRWDVDCTGTTVGACTIYIDGTAVSSATTTSGSTTRNIDNSDGTSGVTAEVRIGRAPSHGAYYWMGLLDEIRFSTNSGMSTSQILAEYNNEFSPTTFYALGASTPVSTVANKRRSITYY